jgi:hypothetical protein
VARACGVALVLLLILAGCGGKPASDAATLVPANALVYATLRPGHDGAVSDVGALRAMAPQWLGRAAGAGPEVDVAVLRTGGVSFTQPRDEKAFAKRLDALGVLHERVAGWTVAGTNRAALDAVRHRRVSLTQTRWFPAARRAAATSDGPVVYVRNGGVQWHAETAAVHGSVLADRVYTGGVPESVSAPMSLAAAAPDDALYVLELADAQEAPTLPNVVGLDVRALLAIVGAPLALWVEPGTPIPAATIVARPPGLRAHARAVGRFLIRQGEGRNAPQRSGALQSVDLGPITVYWGIVGGELVVSNAANAPGSPGRKLPDLLREAKVSPRVTQLTYIDDERALPVFRTFAALANETLPPAFVLHATPLVSELWWTARSGRVTISELYRRAR